MNFLIEVACGIWINKNNEKYPKAQLKENLKFKMNLPTEAEPRGIWIK